MFKTLRAKLFIFFLLVTLIPLVFIGYISYQSQKEELKKQIEQSLLSHSNYLADEIESLLIERISDVKHLATNPVLTNPNSKSLEIKEQFSHFLNAYDIYSDTIFVEPEGKVITSMIDIVEGKNFSGRVWFDISKQGKVYISDIYLSPVLNKHILVMAVPVFNDQKEVIGVISPSFDLIHLQKVFASFVQEEHMKDLNGYAFLVNKHGDIIAHSNEESLTENYFEKNGITAADLVKLSGERKVTYSLKNNQVVTYAQIDKMDGFNNDWFVGIGVSNSILFEPLQSLFKNYLIIIGLVLIMVMLVVFKLSKYIVDPVERLVTATSNFSIGKPLTPQLKDSYEDINRLNNTFTEMTKRLTEQERGHKKSSLIIKTTDNGVMVLNKQSKKITMFNKTCEDLFNLSNKEVINDTIHNVMKKSSHFQQFIEASQIMNFNDETTKTLELQYQHNQKMSYFLLSLSSLPSLENNDIHKELLVMIHDITEKRRMELELVRSEKLKVVGEMAAGLAHEIRNPLAIIRGFIQLFIKEESGSKKGYFELIIKEIDRVNHFIADLLNIASPKSIGEYKETNIETLLENLLALHKSQIQKNGMRLTKEFESIPNIVIDPNKVQQACINIIQNAIEAMDEGGTLTVGTKNLSDENMITIYIKDTGQGMDSKTVEKLGTPFYTTKETGTGLGLTTSFRVIEEMNGTITVSSEKGKGTLFTITLPI